MLNQLPMLKLKSPTLVFWVGTFLFGPFGVGRFMIGDMVLGFVRLAFVIIPIIFNIVASKSLQNIAYISDSQLDYLVDCRYVFSR
ncbi:TPA: hypothetical protein SE638_001579 [Campylobacter jejuni]|nr:hypothetical protein [Campylobacter jejuni]HEG6558340.1 hypothetical protein [Campylobacter jejuni]